MTKKEINHLEWVYDRMLYVHRENENVDYMIRLKQIVDSFGKEKPVIQKKESMTKTILIIIAGIIVWFIVTFLCFAFFQWDINPGNWTPEVRGNCMTTGCISIFLAVVFAGIFYSQERANIREEVMQLMKGHTKKEES